MHVEVLPVTIVHNTFSPTLPYSLPLHKSPETFQTGLRHWEMQSLPQCAWVVLNANWISPGGRRAELKHPGGDWRCLAVLQRGFNPPIACTGNRSHRLTQQVFCLLLHCMWLTSLTILILTGRRTTQRAPQLVAHQKMSSLPDCGSSRNVFAQASMPQSRAHEGNPLAPVINSCARLGSRTARAM